MKAIKAYIKPHRLSAVTLALGSPGMILGDPHPVGTIEKVPVFAEGVVVLANAGG